MSLIGLVFFFCTVQQLNIIHYFSILATVVDMSVEDHNPRIVKEGWLNKRGTSNTEYLFLIKTVSFCWLLYLLSSVCVSFYVFSILGLFITHVLIISFFLGEHIKNWRKRYFILKENGQFLGHRNRPEHSLTDPLNNFTVKGIVYHMY